MAPCPSQRRAAYGSIQPLKPDALDYPIIPITLFLKILYLFLIKNYSNNPIKTTEHPETNSKNIFFGENHFTIDVEKKNSIGSKIIQHFVAIIFVYILPLYTLWNTPSSIKIVSPAATANKASSISIVP